MIENIRNSKKHTPCERETHLLINDEDIRKKGTLCIDTWSRSTMRWLLRISEVDPDVQIIDIQEEKEDEKTWIVGVRAVVPMGYISFKSRPRNDNLLSSAVSLPDTTSVPS